LFLTGLLIVSSCKRDAIDEPTTIASSVEIPNIPLLRADNGVLVFKNADDYFTAMHTLN
jgi:hypothetical protein